MIKKREEEDIPKERKAQKNKGYKHFSLTHTVHSMFNISALVMKFIAGWKLSFDFKFRRELRLVKKFVTNYNRTSYFKYSSLKHFFDGWDIDYGLFILIVLESLVSPFSFDG